MDRPLKTVDIFFLDVGIEDRIGAQSATETAGLDVNGAPREKSLTRVDLASDLVKVDVLVRPKLFALVVVSLSAFDRGTEAYLNNVPQCDRSIRVQREDPLTIVEHEILQ